MEHQKDGEFAKSLRIHFVPYLENPSLNKVNIYAEKKLMTIRNPRQNYNLKTDEGYFGLIATRDIKMNETILIENPIFAFTGKHDTEESRKSGLITTGVQTYVNYVVEKELDIIYFEPLMSMFPRYLNPKTKDISSKLIAFPKEFNEEDMKIKLITVGDFTYQTTDMERKIIFSERLIRNSFQTMAIVKNEDEPEKAFHYMALYRMTSFLNNSCDPNCTWIISNDNDLRISIKAARDIKADEELTICYHSSISDLKSNYKERKHFILEKFRFLCRCTHCQMQKQRKKH